MKNMKFLLSGMIALGLMTGATTAFAAKAKAKPGMEKCYGIAKAGMNDCGSSGHACAGQSSKDRVATDWVYVPKGTCKRIAGGKTKG